MPANIIREIDYRCEHTNIEIGQIDDLLANINLSKKFERIDESKNNEGFDII